MRTASRDLIGVLEDLARKGRHPISDLLVAGSGAFTRGCYYPPEPVEDARAGSVWFYHAHEPSEARAWAEHGHFHCFALGKRVRKGAKPLVGPEKPGPRSDASVHLAAISIDKSGVPKRLFATNRWVTNEWMFAAPDVVPLVEGFAIRTDKRFALTSRWLSAMLRLFQPQIAWLLFERDRVLGKRRESDPVNYSEDEMLEIVASVKIDLDAHLAALEDAWKKRRRKAA